jgi:hypothetical protein
MEQALLKVALSTVAAFTDKHSRHFADELRKLGGGDATQRFRGLLATVKLLGISMPRIPPPSPPEGAPVVPAVD